MAYNVLKGRVEGSVDQYGDQEIDGIKVFKSTISASVFYDTDAQSPCATLKDVAIKEIQGGVNNSIITFQGEGKARAEYNLNFDGRRLTTKEVCAANFVGSASGLYNIPASGLSGAISATSLQISHGIRDVRGHLQVRAGKGIEISKTGVAVAAESHGGLTFQNNKLLVAPHNCLDITLRGQNLSDDDVFVVHDASRNETRKTSLANLYGSYLNSKVPHPEGPENSVQLRGRKGFSASANLSFDTTNNVLAVRGETRTELLTTTGTATFEGIANHRSAMHMNIVTVSDRAYAVNDRDYTILCDATANPMTVTLPEACNHTGRVIVIKKVNKEKYKLKSNDLTVKVEEGLIDYTNKIGIKYNNSSIVVQSDSVNWWVIGKVGS